MQTVESQITSVGFVQGPLEEVILTYFNEGLAFAEVVPSVVCQSIPEIVAQKSRTPLVEAIINEIYRE